MKDEEELLREEMRKLAARYAERGDPYGWFEEIYRETEEDSERIPWVDFEPNRFLLEWHAANPLRGEGRKALVVGCGLGDEARFLDDLGFRVTAFDVSEKAIEIARRVHRGTDIEFVVADLFDPPRGFESAFEMVLEVYTVQALPPELRTRSIDAISGFVAPGGRLIVVQYLRESGEEETEGPPWPLSRQDLARFEENGLRSAGLTLLEDPEEEDPVKRFVAEYERPADGR